MTFRNPEESHAHSLETLNWLYEHDDFMSSIDTMVDLGCGAGLDAEWWASRTTRDEVPEPLNIRCTALDKFNNLLVSKKYPNLSFQQNDFEKQIFTSRKKYDVLWCHDSFQYAINPLQTLKLWKSIAEPGAMLIIILPQTSNLVNRKLSFIQPNGCFYHYSIVSLIHMLAMTGWDCASGFFKKSPTDPWIHAVAYNSEQEARDPSITSWYDLADSGLLPETAYNSVQRHGYVVQDELVLPWLDKNLVWYGQQ